MFSKLGYFLLLGIVLQSNKIIGFSIPFIVSLFVGKMTPIRVVHTKSGKKDMSMFFLSGYFSVLEKQARCHSQLGWESRKSIRE